MWRKVLVLTQRIRQRRSQVYLKHFSRGSINPCMASFSLPLRRRTDTLSATNEGSGWEPIVQPQAYLICRRDARQKFFEWGEFCKLVTPKNGKRIKGEHSSLVVDQQKFVQRHLERRRKYNLRQRPVHLQLQTYLYTWVRWCCEKCNCNLYCL